MTKLTRAEVRAMTHVAAGKVVRIYRANGNVLKGPAGVGSSVLWRLDAKKFIADGGPTWGALDRTCRQVLTAAGKAALAAGERSNRT